MRRLVLALAIGALTAVGPAMAGEAAAAAEAAALPEVESAILTPTELGLAEPAQGFYPFFGGTGFNTTTIGGFGSGINTFSSIGGCGSFTIVFCPFFSAAPYYSTFPAANQFLGSSSLGGSGTIVLGGFGNGLLGAGFGSPFSFGFGVGTPRVIVLR